MEIRPFSAIVFGLALATASAQQSTGTAPVSQPPAQGGRQGWGQGEREGGPQGRAGGRMGRGLTGTVTAVAADHDTIQVESGDVYVVQFGVNTFVFKQMAGERGRGEAAGPGERGNSRQPIKPADIKVGDAINVMGEIDAAAKSIAATVVVQIDPERARQMREMQANYGKTWLAGKVTGIDGVKVTLLGMVDNATHTFVADENTAFRKRREPITLADIQVGDTIRVEGALKDGIFLAATVNAMAMPPGGTVNVPRSAPAPPQSK